jgi:hypothetical protein
MVAVRVHVQVDVDCIRPGVLGNAFAGVLSFLLQLCEDSRVG